MIKIVLLALCVAAGGCRRSPSEDPAGARAPAVDHRAAARDLARAELELMAESIPPQGTGDDDE